MSFFLQKTGRGRKNFIRLVPTSTNIAVCSRLPRSAAEIGALVGASNAANWFWGGKDTGNGYFSSGALGTKYITESGLISSSDKVNLCDGNRDSANTRIYSSKEFNNDESFAVIVFYKIVHYSGVDPTSYINMSNGGDATFVVYPVHGTSLFTAWIRSPEVMTSAGSDAYSISGNLDFIMYGWDNRTKKGYSIASGALSQSASTVSGPWGNAGKIYIDINSICWCVASLATFVGSDAEIVRDNAVSINASLKLLLKGNGKLTSSCSRVFHRTSTLNYDISRSNCVYANNDGLPIHAALTNLMVNSRNMAGWTLTNVTKTDWKSIASDGMRTLTALNETTANDEHKATIAVTPAATGRHWLEFTSRMSTIGAISVVIDNGTDLSQVNFDSSGVVTNYNANTSGVVIETLGSLLYRVKVPFDVTVLDECTITARGLYLNDETWEDTYAGVATRVAYLGEWSLVASQNPPLVIPISIGAASTAIVPIVDWVDVEALRRLEDAKMETRLRVSVDTWLEQDYCLWTWRKDANNAVEVWLRYTGTSDGLFQFGIGINVIVAGSAAETTMDTGTLVLDSTSGLTYVRDLSVSVSIDSAGVCKWFIRGEPVDTGIPTYETDNYQSGEETIASYTAPVVTSVRLGSSAAGTGQAPMTIKEVLAW